jgi:hypothetical protein
MDSSLSVGTAQATNARESCGVIIAVDHFAGDYMQL